MDRSNLLIGAGVLVGLGTLAYWYMNRDGGAVTTVRYARPTALPDYTAVVQPVLTSPSPAMMAERNF